ncbi:MAG: mannose-1-phosphate guanylyltransferase [Verrucomicrobiota bacterium]|nr:mannose-1-phosphate guanylyltransferase [Verrucomicrobiota bacterium]
MSGQNAHGYALVMAGGSGLRFWPKSRRSRPKQLLRITGGQTMIEQTLDRISPLFAPEHILIVTNAEYADAVRELCPAVPSENVIGEPFGRDTWACVGLAAAWVRARDPEGVIGVVSADHVIHNRDGFAACFHDILALVAQRNCLMTIGVTPEHPATGYGYIQIGDQLTSTPGQTRFHEVLRFHEKPTQSEAEGYLASGDFLWNAGTFAWSCASIWAAMEAHTPELFQAAVRFEHAFAAGASQDALDEVLKEEYGRLDKRPVDKAIMQPANNVVMARADFDWDDVGAFPSLDKHFPHDEQGNLVQDVIFAQVDCKDCIVLGESSETDPLLIGGIGLEGMMIVRTPDAILVCPKDRAQDIKKLADQIGRKPGLARWT